MSNWLGRRFWSKEQVKQPVQKCSSPHSCPSVLAPGDPEPVAILSAEPLLANGHARADYSSPGSSAVKSCSVIKDKSPHDASISVSSSVLCPSPHEQTHEENLASSKEPSGPGTGVGEKTPKEAVGHAVTAGSTWTRSVASRTPSPSSSPRTSPCRGRKRSPVVRRITAAKDNDNMTQKESSSPHISSKSGERGEAEGSDNYPLSNSVPSAADRKRDRPQRPHSAIDTVEISDSVYGLAHGRPMSVACTPASHRGRNTGNAASQYNLTKRKLSPSKSLQHSASQTMRTGDNDDLSGKPVQTSDDGNHIGHPNTLSSSVSHPGALIATNRNRGNAATAESRSTGLNRFSSSPAGARISYQRSARDAPAGSGMIAEQSRGGSSCHRAAAPTAAIDSAKLDDSGSNSRADIKNRGQDRSRAYRISPAVDKRVKLGYRFKTGSSTDLMSKSESRKSTRSPSPTTNRNRRSYSGARVIDANRNIIVGGKPSTTWDLPRQHPTKGINLDRSDSLSSTGGRNRAKTVGTATTTDINANRSDLSIASGAPPINSNALNRSRSGLIEQRRSPRAPFHENRSHDSLSHESSQSLMSCSSAAELCDMDDAMHGGPAHTYSTSRRTRGISETITSQSTGLGADQLVNSKDTPSAATKGASGGQRAVGKQRRGYRYPTSRPTSSSSKVAGSSLFHESLKQNLQQHHQPSSIRNQQSGGQNYLRQHNRQQHRMSGSYRQRVVEVKDGSASADTISHGEFGLPAEEQQRIESLHNEIQQRVFNARKKHMERARKSSGEKVAEEKQGSRESVVSPSSLATITDVDVATKATAELLPATVRSRI